MAGTVPGTPRKDPLKLDANIKAPFGLKLIAGAKLAKGIVLACLSLGVLDLIHSDLPALALRFLEVARISPENRYVVFLLDKVGLVDTRTLVRLGILSALYASILLVEGFGLWIGAAWAEYMVVISSGVFVPEECLILLHKFTWLRLSILLVNAAILVYVAKVVWDRYHLRRSRRAAPGGVPAATREPLRLD
ncbi:MAG: DUF2127 domain-containing protein [Opitutaceae bacterium]|jgi:uncharacterized membrane protein (DUF2068 family)